MVPVDPPQNPSRRARGRPRDWHDKTAQNTIKSLDRAMMVFEHLSTQPGQSLSGIAEDLKQSPATVYRVLVTLEGRGLVSFDPATQLWHIGAQAFVIGAQFLRRTSLVERARPILRALMETTGETANLGIARNGQVVFLSQVETHETVRAFFPPGTMSPLHASGIGKALLAEMPETAVEQVITGTVLERFTPGTLVEAEKLRADLAATRARGHAIDDEEKSLGMRCIAAPVFDVHGEAVAGISVSGPSNRMDVARLASISQEVMRAAAGLSRAIGGHPRSHHSTMQET